MKRSVYAVYPGKKKDKKKQYRIKIDTYENTHQTAKPSPNNSPNALRMITTTSAFLIAA